MTADTFWKKLQATGWLQYIPAEQQAEQRQRLAETLKTDPKHAYLCLHTTEIDTEGIDHEHAYRDILAELAAVSLGAFAPTQIKEKHNERLEVAQVSFKHAQQTFSREVPLIGHCFEIGVLNLVNQALAASGAAPRFIPLPIDDQVLFLAFVPPAVYDMAARAGLVPADNEYIQQLKASKQPATDSRIDEALLALFHSKKPGDRQRAVIRLGGTRQAAKAAFPILVEALQDPDRSVRDFAIDALARVGPRSVPALEGTLHDRHPLTRMRAACSLLRIGNHAGAAAVLTEAIRPGRDKKLRSNAMYELVEMGKAAEPLLPELLTALDDKDRDIADGACLAIQRLGAKARPAIPELLKRLNGTSIKAQRQATGILGAIGAKAEMVPHLIQALAGPSRYEAVCALGDIGPAARAAVPYLVEALGDPNITWYYAAHALKRIGPPTPGAAAVLIGKMKKERSLPRRFVIATELAELDPGGAVDAIPILARDARQKKNHHRAERIRKLAMAINPQVAQEYGLGGLP